VSSSGPLEKYAKAQDLRFHSGCSLPPHGNLLTRGGRAENLCEGTLAGGVEGTLAYYGVGSKRADRVAVVAGPAGPVAESELEAEPQGLTTKDLDTYLEQLAGEDRGAVRG
jgi:hypothetical protein